MTLIVLDHRTVSRLARQCADGFDNDGDGATDCDDTDCAQILAVRLATFRCDCTDGIDNDGNGQTDCDDQLCTFLDPACTGGGGGTPEQDCTNGADDDGDGAVDCDDSDCSSDAACIIMGAEICDDDGDNDGDGDIDCADSDCAGNPCCDTSNPLVDFSECDCTDGFDNADNVIDCDDISVSYLTLLVPVVVGHEVDCVNISDDDGDGLLIVMIRLCSRSCMFNRWDRDLFGWW